MSLSEALALAAQQDPTVPVVLATYEAEKEAGPQERASLRPSLSAKGSANYAYTDSRFAFGSAPPETYPSWSATLEARQPLFRLDWQARGERANAQDALAEANLKDRKQQLLQRVAERYFGVLIAEDNYQQAEAEQRAVRESLEGTRKRFEVGEVPGTDLKEARARDDLAQVQVLITRRALETARDTLDETTGKGRETLPALPEDVRFPPLSPAEAERWVQAASENSPVLITAREQLAVKASKTQSRRAEAMPSLDLVGSASHNDSTQYSLGQLQDDARIGLELNVPIFAGGINASRVREAAALQRAADADVKRLSLESARQVRQIHREVTTGQLEAQAYQQALESARAAETATQYGYEAGTRTITDVLDAKSRVVQAARDRNRSRYNLLLNVLRLKQAAGVLSEKDFQAIDQLLAPAAG